MSKVFISYRRDDSAGYAHAIHSRLVQHFSKDQVFMDVDTVEPGVDFVRAIEKAVGECNVLVALIGKRWMGGEPGGTSRLDSGGETQPVGGKKPNGFGLYDMSGNVAEWVEDCWHYGYSEAPTNGSVWKDEGNGRSDLRMIRGGSYLNAPGMLRSSSRHSASPVDQHSAIGFRLARDID